MPELNGKMAGFVAVIAVVGGLPLLAFMYLFLQLMAARDAGLAQSGDGIGLAMMSAVAYVLALLSLTVGAGYFGYKRARQKVRLKIWHWLALAWLSAELVAPICYFMIL